MANPRNLSNIAPLFSKTTSDTIDYSGTNLKFGGTAQRFLIKTDGTQSDRFAFQSTATNGNTRLWIYPSGTGNITGVTGHTSSSDFTNYNAFDLAILGGATQEVRISSNAAGTATAYPITFRIGASEEMRLTSTGLGIGTTSPTQRLDVRGNMYMNGTNARIYVDNGGIGGSSVQLGVSGTSHGYIGTDGNFPLVFQPNNTERMRLDSSGNLGLGVTPSAWGNAYKALQVSTGSSYAASSNAAFWFSNAYNDNTDWRYVTSTNASGYTQFGGAHIWYTAPSGTAGNAISFTQAMTLSASGGLSIGLTSDAGANNILLNAGGKLCGNAPSGSTSSTIELYNASTGNMSLTAAFSTAAITFASGGTTERARITSGGDLLVGTTTSYGSRKFEVRGGATGTFLSTFGNTNSNPIGVQIYYDGYDPNGTGNEFLNCNGNGTVRATIRSNGGLANYSANDVNLSDRREKTNFAPAKSYLDTICAIPVQTFNYIDQSEDDPGLTLGVVAQDVQAVAPELVMESNWGTEDAPKMRLSIYQTDLQYALMKALQELKAQNDDLRARVAALESQP